MVAGASALRLRGPAVGRPGAPWLELDLVVLGPVTVSALAVVCLFVLLAAAP